MTEISRIIASRGAGPRATKAKNPVQLWLTKSAYQVGAADVLRKFGAAAALLNHEQMAVFEPYLLGQKELAKEYDKQKYELGFDDVFEALQGAVQTGDLAKINATAQAYLDKSPVQSLASVPDILRKAHHFLTDWDGSLRAQELIAFAKSRSTQDIFEFSMGAPKQVDTLKTQAICAMATRTLGQLPCDILALMKTVLAFDLIARQTLAGADAGKFPVTLVTRLLQSDVMMPDMLFFDLHKVDDRAKSPLAQAVAARGDLRRDPCACDCDTPPVCTPPQPGCPDIQYFVADYLTLDTATKCYVPGDLAYIENIAPFEKRARLHAFEEVIETTFEEVETIEARSKRDHTMTDRSQLDATMEKKRSQDAMIEGRYGTNAQNYLMGRVTLSASQTHKTVRNVFKESVDKVVTELNREVQTTRKSVTTTTEKETNNHTFDNKTEKAARAKYFYVNRRVRGQVMSYDVRGQVHIDIPTPAAMLEYLETQRQLGGFDMEEPTHPGISMPELKPENHDAYITQFGLTGVTPPPQQQPVRYESVTMHKDTTDIVVPIPSGYTATLLTRMGGSIKRSVGVGFSRISMYAGMGNVGFNTKGTGGTSHVLNAVGSITCTINHTSNTGQNSSVTARITLTPDAVNYTQWREDMYAAIMAAYEAELAAYNAARDAYLEKAEGEKYNLHPMQLEQIVRTQIKRAAIYMMCENFETPNIVNPKSVPCGAPTINRLAAETYLREKHFWEHAFDWELMTFKFYDYLFGHQPCDWPNKYYPQHDHKMYSDFLSAGHVRMQVPIALNMEDDFAWYVQTGEIWGQTGTPPVNQNDPRYINLVTEIAHSKNCFQTTREGKVTAIYDLAATTPTLTHQVMLTGSDAYWDPFGGGTVNQAAIDLDLNRQIFIDGDVYVIADITIDPNSPPYAPNGPSLMQWIITLDRVFTGTAALDQSNAVFPDHAFAIGALLVDAPFEWEEWTDMVWLGDTSNACLPCYPVEC